MGFAANGRVSTSSRRASELDPETVGSVKDYLASRAARGVAEPRWADAWERFYAAYDPLVRRLACRRCRSAFELDDRVQDVWLAVAAHFLRYDPERGPLERWFTVIIRTVLARRHRSLRPLRHLDDESKERIVSRDPDPTIVFDEVLRRFKVRSALEELRATISQTNHQILYDRWIEGKSFGEIAKALGLTAKQARDRHSRVVHKLHDRLLAPAGSEPGSEDPLKANKPTRAKSRQHAPEDTRIEPGSSQPSV